MITIQRLIIHKVDHKRYEEPQLSDLMADITSEISDFLTEQIITNREHRYSRAAIFLDADGYGNEFLQVCSELFEVLHNELGRVDPSSEVEATDRVFVEQSRVVAVRLYDHLDGRTSPGDLVICQYQDDIVSSATSIALLKMDPRTGFAGEIQDVDGLRRIVLRPVKDVLPTGELQKCAFISAEYVSEKLRFQIRVLDQQAIRFGISSVAATFFTKDFLQCEVEPTPDDITRKFAYSSNEWVEKKRGIWTDEEIEVFIDAIGEVLDSPRVDIAAFAASRIRDPEDLIDYLTHVQTRGIRDLVFDVDENERKKFRQYAFFEGPDGLRIRILAESVGPGRTMEFEELEGTGETRIIITTPSLRRLIKRSGR